MDAIIGTGNISKRKYNIITDHDISVPMSDGVNIKIDICRPDDKGKFPALVGMSPFNKEYQRERVWPAPPMGKRVRGITNADLEAGSTDVFVRRGYVHIIGSVRGTGKSEGVYRYLDSREIEDVYELIEWAAKQPWCNGNISMLGMAYFATHQPEVAALQPPHLKCIAPMFAFWDNYRYFWWTGGVVWSGFLRWLFSPDDMDIHTQESILRNELGDDKFKEAIAQALADKDISADPALVDILRNPEAPGNAAILDILLHPIWGPYWQERAIADYSKIKIPVYLGVSGHRPGALYHWSDLKVPKKLISCPPAYVDRPFNQYSWELLRWYDYWLKGIDTGIMDEPAVRLFIPGANEWLSADDWPIPNTKWIPFNLHENRSLCEIEPWPEASSASYDDAPGNRGCLIYSSAPMVENTEIAGPVVLNLYASCRGTDTNFFVSLWDADPNGKEICLTRGWLKASYNDLDLKQSKPWHPIHRDINPKPLIPGQVYQFAISLLPTTNLFKAGHRIVLKICGADDESDSTSRWRMNRLSSQTPVTVTIYHNAKYPSHLILPITRGNIIGTYVSGGDISLKSKEFMKLV